MNTTINPEFTVLQEKVENQGKELVAQSKEIAEMRGGLQQLDKIVGATTRQSIWQLIALLATLCVTILGAMIYLTNTIEKRFEQIEKNQLLHREAIENRIDQSEKNMNMRFEQFERNITARFDDLKQEVRARRK